MCSPDCVEFESELEVCAYLRCTLPLAQGRYEILSLSGSYVPTEGENGAKQRTGGLSVSLAGSDGRVFGGGVAGLLTAASPIQVRMPATLYCRNAYTFFYGNGHNLKL